MKYNIDKIENDSSFFLFWGHQPSKDGAITKSCLSQWWQCIFVINSIEYKTAEHWMMAEKARLFSDTETLEKILQAKTPADAKKLGRQVKNFDEKIWNEKRFEIVKVGNYHKFSQHVELKNFLLGIKETVIVEASPVDKIWGIGMAAEHPFANQPNNWKGLNLLGFALMEVRDQLKQKAIE